MRHIVFGHRHVPLTGVGREDIAFRTGQPCTHRSITDPDAGRPRWTGEPPCYRTSMIAEHGFSAHGVDVGQTAISQ